MLKIIGNPVRSFDEQQTQKLGKYVYALRDPRDRKIFYVGQGTGNRVFSHFSEAESVAQKPELLTSKTHRIIEIWNADDDVEYLILAHALNEQGNEADIIESSCIDTLRESQNGEVLNNIAAPKSSFLDRDGILALAATHVQPSDPHKCVFIFPIQRALSSRTDDVYEATRREWRIAESLRMPNTLAVGIRNGICQGTFSIQSWEQLDNGKCAFTGTPSTLFDNTSWTMVLNKAMGYWQRGNYLVVEFDGKGQLRFLRGSQDKTAWLSLR
jgi:hypothetical protein